MTLEALAAAALRGDGSALSTLCERLQAPIYRLCLRMLGDARDAEDAAQDVLVKVITNLSQFEQRSALTTWVHQITVRHVMALSLGRRETGAPDEAGFTALLEKGLAYGATQPPHDAADQVLVNEVRLACTQGMLLMLTREERLALVLVELMGFDSSVAAEVAGVRADAFRQRLTRARARLSAFLENQCGETNEAARCRCEKQVAAKKTLGLTPVLSRLSAGDAISGEALTAAGAELSAVRRIASAFQRDGLFRAPDSLRARLQSLLPTVLATSAT